MKKSDERQLTIAEEAKFISDWVAKVLAIHVQYPTKPKHVEEFVPDKLERDLLATVPAVQSKFRNKLKRRNLYAVADICCIVAAVTEELPSVVPPRQADLLMVARKMVWALHSWLDETANSKFRQVEPEAATIYQFKITLLDSQPPIWRRILVPDCTLDGFHEHIQTAMGWTNSHLHIFTIGRQLYGDSQLLEEMGDVGLVDSMTTRLSRVIPATEKSFAIGYEYDFGDGWRHEILFEGFPKPKPRQKIPCCIEGERACPPENVGGVRGYVDFLKAIADPLHPDHQDLRKWVGGEFAPERFDPVAATRAMKQGLPDWRTAQEDDL